MNTKLLKLIITTTILCQGVNIFAMQTAIRSIKKVSPLLMRRMSSEVKQSASGECFAQKSVSNHNLIPTISSPISCPVLKAWVKEKSIKSFFEIAKSRNKESTTLLKHFLDLGISPNYGVDEHLTSALAHAAENNCIENVRLLLEHGANIEGEEERGFGYTPLWYAAGSSSFEAIEELLKAGANPNKVNACIQNTPLENAIRCFSHNREDIHNAANKVAFIEKYKKTIALLLKHTQYRPELLRVAIRYNDWHAFTEITKEHKDRLFSDPKLFESAYHNLDMIQALLNAGLNPNAYDLLPLHEHVSAPGDEKIIDILIEGGADINRFDKNGMTPLMIAARGMDYPQHTESAGANIEAVKILLKAKADITIKCNKGLAVIDHTKQAMSLGNFWQIDTDRAPILFSQEEHDKAINSYKTVIKLLEAAETN